MKSIDKLPLENRDFKGKIIESNQIICGKDFTHVNFEFVGANNIEFINCNFSFSRFKDVYFRNCSFVNCRFIGSKWSDSNFTRINLTKCDLSYVEFKNVHLESTQVIKNLPKEPNVKQKLLQNLRKNFESRGERESIKKILKYEIDASHEYYEDAITNKNSYYSKEYNTPYKRIKLRIEKYKHKFFWYSWGHGEFPFRIFLMAFALLILCSAFQSFTNLNFQAIPAEVVDYILNQFGRILFIFLGIKEEPIFNSLGEVNIIVRATVIVIRYSAVGMFISALTRRYSWR